MCQLALAQASISLSILLIAYILQQQAAPFRVASIASVARKLGVDAETLKHHQLDTLANVAIGLGSAVPAAVRSPEAAAGMPVVTSLVSATASCSGPMPASVRTASGRRTRQTLQVNGNVLPLAAPATGSVTMSDRVALARLGVGAPTSSSCSTSTHRASFASASSSSTDHSGWHSHHDSSASAIASSGVTSTSTRPSPSQLELEGLSLVAPPATGTGTGTIGSSGSTQATNASLPVSGTGSSLNWQRSAGTLLWVANSGLDSVKVGLTRSTCRTFFCTRLVRLLLPVRRFRLQVATGSTSNSGYLCSSVTKHLRLLALTGVVEYNHLETTSLLVLIAVLLLGIVFTSKGFAPRSVGYHSFTSLTILPVIILSSAVAFVVLLVIEVYRSFKLSHLTELARKQELETVERAMMGG
jgi:hypothetical protein